ncbi:MAG: ribosome modulation factor [Oleispira sp.]
MASNNEMELAYQAGYIARDENHSNTECPHGYDQLNLRCQWLGGWNDSDMEDK